MNSLSFEEHLREDDYKKMPIGQRVSWVVNTAGGRRTGTVYVYSPNMHHVIVKSDHSCGELVELPIDSLTKEVPNA